MANTGYRAWTTLEEYFTDTSDATGRLKPNVDTDPDYVAPVINYSICPLANPPVNTSWESGLESWTQEAANAWTYSSGTTPSSNTGPTTAYDGTYYWFTEASGIYSTPHILKSPEWAVTDDTKWMLFAYHMYGAAMGTLEVKIDSGGPAPLIVWTESGDKGDNWFTGVVDLSTWIGSLITIQFVGTTGTNFTSDMAIDHVRFSSTVGDTTAPIYTQPLTTGIITTTSIALNWQTSDNVLVTSQQVFWRISGGSYASINVSSQATSFTKTGLTAGTTYNFYIRACDAAGNCANSGTVTETTSSGVTTYLHFLGYDGSSSSNSCFASTNAYYTDNQNFPNSTKIWNNSSGTFPAASGYYSDGGFYLYWNGSSVTQNNFCQI